MENNFYNEKKTVLEFYNELEHTKYKNLKQTYQKYVLKNFKWRSVYPFRKERDIHNLEQAYDVFWKPFTKAISNLTRRQEVFIGGNNEIENGKWIFCMGKFYGNFDQDFINIKATRKTINMRFAEFSHVKDGKIVEQILILDILAFMKQAGYEPFPKQTGNFWNYPAPVDQNALLYKDASHIESKKTKELIEKFVADLGTLNNKPFNKKALIDVYKMSFSDNFSWYGPYGIGASYTIPRYLEQHSIPFRKGLADKVFNGHIVRFAEGPFSCFVGWPNLSNRPVGGWLGMPEYDKVCEMQVVDVYYRKDDKIYENWVFIDIPYWLSQQKIDIIGDTLKR